jgi:hypothetical protein
MVAPLQKCVKIDLRRPKAALKNPDKGIVYIIINKQSCTYNSNPKFHTIGRQGCASEGVFKIDLRRPKAALENLDEAMFYTTEFMSFSMKNTNATF